MEKGIAEKSSNSVAQETEEPVRPAREEQPELDPGLPVFHWFYHRISEAVLYLWGYRVGRRPS